MCVCACACVCACCLVMANSLWLPWTVAHQAPLSMELSQARTLELVAISSSRGSSQPRDWTWVSCRASGFFQFSSVAQSYPTLYDPMDCSTPGFPVHHQLPELTQTHVHWANDAIQLSHPLSSPSPPTFNLSQHQGIFQWVGSSHQVAKVLEFQLQHQSFQWIFRTGFL